MSSNSGLRNFARGSAVTLVGQFFSVGISLVSIVVLSRLLPPSDFGLVAMVGVVTTLGTILRDMGLSVSALRVPTLTDQQASNLFWINVVMSIVTATLVALSGPILVQIYSEPRLAPITPVLALSLLFGGLQAQVQVQLSRAHRFTTLALINAGAAAFGLVVAIAAALAGMGYWALVLQTVVTIATELVAKVIASRWVPLRPRRLAGTKVLAVSGGDLAAGSIVQYFANNAATFMIGVRMGAADVGVYNRGYQLVQLPIQFLTPLRNVAVPTLMRAKKKGEDTKKQLLQIQSFVGMWITLTLVVAAAIAPTLFRVVLGADWEPAAPLFRILAIGGVALGLSQVSNWAFLVEGSTRELLKYNLISKPMTTAFIVVGALISLEATAVGLSLGLVASWVLNVWWLERTANLPGKEFYLNALRIVLAGGLSLGITLLVNTVLPANVLVMLTAPALLSAALFFALLATTKKGRREITWAFNAITSLVKGRGFGKLGK